LNADKKEDAGRQLRDRFCLLLALVWAFVPCGFPFVPVHSLRVAQYLPEKRIDFSVAITQ
jgi:hypothetical protein